MSGMKIKALIGINIRTHRERLRLTQKQAAGRVGITVNYWSRLELVSQPDLPSLSTLIKIAEALNIKPYRLLVARLGTTEC
jgi:transcriptional regulator with XRE-family HTH domain